MSENHSGESKERQDMLGLDSSNAGLPRNSDFGLFPSQAAIASVMLTPNTTMQTMHCCVRTTPGHTLREQIPWLKLKWSVFCRAVNNSKSIAVPVQYYCHHMLTAFPVQVGHVISFMLYFLTSYCFMLNLDFK